MRIGKTCWTMLDCKYLNEESGCYKKSCVLALVSEDCVAQCVFFRLASPVQFCHSICRLHLVWRGLFLAFLDFCM